MNQKKMLLICFFSLAKGTWTEQYQNLVKSNPWISMVDPSGGPFINEHSKLDIFGEELKGLCVQLFEPIETGYKIITYGEFDHLADTKIIGGIINTTEK